MQRSKVNVILHFAWATWHREPLLTDEIERLVHRSMIAEAEALDCPVLAVGGMPDHVHLVLKVHPRLAIADLMRRVKSVSSLAGRKASEGVFGWQDNYGVTSVSPKDRDVIVRYVQNQREHHQAGTTWPAAEAYAEDQPIATAAASPEDD